MQKLQQRSIQFCSKDHQMIVVDFVRVLLNAGSNTEGPVDFSPMKTILHICLYLVLRYSTGGLKMQTSHFPMVIEVLQLLLRNGASITKWRNMSSTILNAATKISECHNRQTGISVGLETCNTLMDGLYLCLLLHTSTGMSIACKSDSSSVLYGVSFLWEFLEIATLSSQPGRSTKLIQLLWFTWMMKHSWKS